MCKATQKKTSCICVKFSYIVNRRALYVMAELVGRKKKCNVKKIVRNMRESE